MVVIKVTNEWQSESLRINGSQLHAASCTSLVPVNLCNYIRLLHPDVTVLIATTSCRMPGKGLNDPRKVGAILQLLLRAIIFVAYIFGSLVRDSPSRQPPHKL